ncbi:hypothetical protein Gorai_022485 [Gossypium raimondii]|uniref:Acyl carrier protein n=1 Tax=Gossypium raimondii TaxID=29730 RepID=A0A7J8NTD5_GOSRA|nr:hypothetical protein [Gossypium raimondii]
MAAVREALLKRLRVNATSLSLLRNPKPSLNGLFALTFNAVHRRFSDDVMGSFLDKSEVTDRVVSVVKNFQKVDPSKVFSFSFHDLILSVVLENMGLRFGLLGILYLIFVSDRNI